MIRVMGGVFLHMMDDVDAGVLILAWLFGEMIFIKNRIWLRWI